LFLSNRSSRTKLQQRPPYSVLRPNFDEELSVIRRQLSVPIDFQEQVPSHLSLS
jgi:hypothetical protein